MCGGRVDVRFELTFPLTWYIHVARVIQFSCRVVDRFVFCLYARMYTIE